MALQTDLLLDNEKIPATSQIHRTKVVNTLLKMIEDYEPIKGEKDQKTERVEALYLNAIDGERPTRMSQFPSFLVPEVLESWMSIVSVPDSRLKDFGTDVSTLTIMSKFLEQKVYDGGFNKLMTNGFGGYRQGGLYGDFWVMCGLKTTGDVGMPQYRGGTDGAMYFNNAASAMRSHGYAENAYRSAIVFQYDWQSLDESFPGMQKHVTPGKLPSAAPEVRANDGKTDLQRSGINQEMTTDVAYFFDIRDPNNPIESIVAGANAYTYKKMEGPEEYEHYMKIDGERKAVIPWDKFGMFPYPKGIYDAGIGEVFYKLSVSEGDINTSFVNNTLDNNYAPAIINIDNASAEDVFSQLAIAHELKRKGENAFVVPNLDEEAKASGKQLGRSSVDYLKNEPFSDQNQALIDRFEQVVSRMGFNLDINFTDPAKTLGQTELDIVGANKTVSKIQAQNLEFYEFIYSYAISAIIEHGDVNNDKPFGSDIKLTVGGKEMSVAEMQETAGEKGSVLTEGQVIQLFKDKADTLELEINLVNGVKHNKLLERRALERQLNVAAPGSPIQIKLLKKLHELESDEQISDEAFMGQAEEQGGVPQAPNTQGQLTAQLTQ